MKKEIDNFSAQAEVYQKFRPTYPHDLYVEILKHVPHKLKAWDCGTGSGQVAIELANYFEKVIATDISDAQLKNAPSRKNIFYKKCRAEKTDIPDHSINLITVAQALHWFDFPAFEKEVLRVAKRGCILAVWGYNLLRINKSTDQYIDRFYHETIGPYWNEGRKHVDLNYESIPFPFDQINIDNKFSIKTSWDIRQMEGYLNTWSSVQRYISANNKNPVTGFIEELKQVWPGGKTYKITFPASKQVYVYTSPEDVTICRGATLCSGAPALPDFEISVDDLFA